MDEELLAQWQEQLETQQQLNEVCVVEFILIYICSNTTLQALSQTSSQGSMISLQNVPSRDEGFRDVVTKTLGSTMPESWAYSYTFSLI